MALTSSLKEYSFKRKTLVIILAAAAGLIYNSWPLGFILDPKTAQVSQASDLETIGHPYYKLFIGGDVVSSLLLIAAAILIWYYSTNKLRASLISFGLITFGLFTGIAALLPASCTVDAYFRCGAGYNHGLGLDLVFSSLAILGLLLAMIVRVIGFKRAKQLKTELGITTLALTLIWVLSLIIFSVLAVRQLRAANIAQYVELSLAGLAMIILSFHSNNNRDH
jgi:hypothetical protein